jgi:hypothetical protein
MMGERGKEKKSQREREEGKNGTEERGRGNK